MADWLIEAKKPGGVFDMTRVEIRAKASFWTGDGVIQSYFLPFDGICSYHNPAETRMRYSRTLRDEGYHIMTGPAFVMKKFVSGMPHYVRNRCFVPDGAEAFENIKPLAQKRDWRKLFSGWRWAGRKGNFNAGQSAPEG